MMKEKKVNVAKLIYNGSLMGVSCKCRRKGI